MALDTKQIIFDNFPPTGSLNDPGRIFTVEREQLDKLLEDAYNQGLCDGNGLEYPGPSGKPIHRLSKLPFQVLEAPEVPFGKSLDFWGSGTGGRSSAN